MTGNRKREFYFALKNLVLWADLYPHLTPGVKGQTVTDEEDLDSQE